MNGDNTQKRNQKIQQYEKNNKVNEEQIQQSGMAKKSLNNCCGEDRVSYEESFDKSAVSAFRFPLDAGSQLSRGYVGGRRFARRFPAGF